MKIKSLIVLFGTIMLICSCQHKNIDTTKNSVLQEQKIAKDEESTADTISVPPPPPKQEAPKQKPSPLTSDNNWDRKIIKTGTLSMEVKNYKIFTNQLNDMVKKNGGYIAKENETQMNDRIQNNITIKVPVERFTDLMNNLANTNEKILDKQISSEDATTELVDTKARIEAKKKIRERYLELLQQAKKMDDILSVQSEINDVQEQIELAEGRSAYLSHAAAFSTIELSYFQMLEGNNITNDQPSFADRMHTAFDSGWNFIKGLLIVMITIWPVWFIGIIGVVIYKVTKQWSSGIKARS